MRRVMLFATAAVLLLSACGADPRTGSAGTSPSSATASTAVSNQTAPEALRFTAPSVGGGSLDLSTYAGQTVAFWFWAPT